MSRLACGGDRVAVVRDRALLFFDETATRVGEHELGKPADSVARFGDEWLVLAAKEKHLGRIGADAPTATFASGKGAIRAFAVGRDDSVAVARGEAVELWSRDDEKRWSTKGAALARQIVIGRDEVVVLGEDGALYFFSREKGEALGALRLASTDPASTWCLAHVDGVVVVLALGDWLVWIDSSTRKTVRRVRARAKVRALAADGEHVAVAVEDGFVQAFRAKNGEPRASLAFDGDDVAAIALGAGSLFAVGEASVRSRARQTLDAAALAELPVTSIAARGSIVAAGDRSGRIRLLSSIAGELSAVGEATGGEPPAGLFVAKNETIIVAGQRLVTFATVKGADGSAAPSRAVESPRPIVLKSAPTAFAADDAYAFVGTQAGAVDVYEQASGRHVTSYALSSDDRITALVRLAPSALLVVGTGALDGRLLVVDVAEAKVVHRVSPHEEAFGVTCLASEARGRLVASGSDEGAIVLVDPVKGRALAKIRVSETPIALAFEPTGRRLACVFADKTAALVTFTQKAATVADLGLRGVTHVAWADALVFGFDDGRVESGDRHARPSEPPAAARN